MVNTIWSEQASIKHRGGFPLRPPPDVVNIMNELIRPVFEKKEQCYQAVLLGVTPELVNLAWPSNVRLQAFDQSLEVISALWQANPNITSFVQQASWQDMPIESSSIDVIVGDGCTTQLPNTLAYRTLFSELRRVLASDGSICMRCFIRPDFTESLDSIVEDLYAGQIKYFGSLKWRIAMASVPQQGSFSIKLQAIHAMFDYFFGDRIVLANATGWSPEMINTIDLYKNMTAEYSFPNLSQLTELIAPYFKIVDVRYGEYELSDRCPIITLQPQKV